MIYIIVVNYSKENQGGRDEVGKVIAEYLK